jgi:hypothetical protein
MTTENQSTHRIVFGVFADPLRKQLRGLQLKRSDIERWQKDADAICRLRIRSFLTDKESNSARSRIVKEIFLKHYNKKRKPL